jgi:hypothetical protein
VTARLKREVLKLPGERDILKNRGLLREGVDVKFAFIAKHRGIWAMDWICGARGVSRHAVPKRVQPLFERSDPNTEACKSQVSSGRGGV